MLFTRTATRTEASILLRSLALMIADRDGIHPSHAFNRVRAACSLIDAIDRMPFADGERSPVLMSRDMRAVVSSFAGVQASAATWDVAALIHAAEREVL